MATIQQHTPATGTRRPVRAKRIETHLDMTPMVDLAFLLLTFFILTTTFMKATWMDIAMPLNGPPDAVPASQSLTLLLTGSDRVLWYVGVDELTPASPTGIATLSKEGPNRIHQIILAKNKLLLAKIQAVKDSVAAGLIPNQTSDIMNHMSAVKASDKKGLTVLIKADDQTKYRSLVAVLDEMLSCHVAHYAITDLSANDRQRIRDNM